MARKVKSYDLFAAHGWYTPGVGGMFALLGWFLVGMLLGSVVQWIALAFVSQQTVLDYGMIVVYPIQFIPAMLYVARQSQRNALFEKGYALDSASFAPFSPWAAAGLTLLATVSGIFVFDLVNYANMQLTLRSPSLSEFYSVFMNLMRQLTGGPFWSSFLTVAIMAPIFEEWLCRGMVLRGLLVKMKPSWAIILSALFFALIHANPWQALNAFLIGVLMGYIYYKTGSLKLTMLMHFANNACALVLNNLTGLENAEGWQDVLPGMRYWLVFGACILALVLIYPTFARIPVEREEGNMDPVKPLFEE